MEILYTNCAGLDVHKKTVIWVRGARLAILRADRAEEIAAFERRELERQQLEIEQKQQLDTGIQQLIQTHVEVANGNFPLGHLC